MPRKYFCRLLFLHLPARFTDEGTPGTALKIITFLSLDREGGWAPILIATGLPLLVGCRFPEAVLGEWEVNADPQPGRIGIRRAHRAPVQGDGTLENGEANSDASGVARTGFVDAVEWVK
jgi:hypothetical protein